jgi:hypothetical protein
MTVTPSAVLATVVPTAGSAILVVDANPQGGLLQNPLQATDQGITTAEPLLIDPTGVNPTLEANGTTFSIVPGQTWDIIPGQTTQTKVTAATGGHKFSGIQW